MSESAHSHKSLRVVGRRYLLRRVLGTGGMGRVWLAHDKASGNDVALKEVRLETLSGEADRRSHLSRAWLEALHALSVAKSSNIVKVLDVFEEDGRPWIVMELVIGKTLAQAVAQYGPLPPVQVAHIGKKVLMALTACHVKEIVHRDVKPSNILLADDGRVLLTDFGIAVGGDHYDVTVGSLTPSGIAVGTPEYMAPERVKGRPATAASDLFSLGATLYFAVEGRSPFRRDSFVASSAAVLFDPVGELKRGRVFEQLLSGLLEKDPADRTKTAEAYDQVTRIIDYNGAIPFDGDVQLTSGPTATTPPIVPSRITDSQPAGAHRSRLAGLWRASAVAVAVAVIGVLTTSLFLLRSGSSSTASPSVHHMQPSATAQTGRAAPLDRPVKSTPPSPAPRSSIQCLQAGSGVAVKPGLQGVTVGDITSCLPPAARHVLQMYPIGTCLSDWPPGPSAQLSQQCGQLVNGSVTANRIGAVWLASFEGDGSTECQGTDVSPDGDTWTLWTDGLAWSLCAVGAKD